MNDVTDLHIEEFSDILENFDSIFDKEFHVTGRFWIWKMGINSFLEYQEDMLKHGIMRIDAPGFRDFRTYHSVSQMEEVYSMSYPNHVGIISRPYAYYAFLAFLRKGDIVIACSDNNTIIGWGIVEGDYRYSIKRKHGRHWRKVTWFRFSMPFVFSHKNVDLYQIDNGETHNLKDTLFRNIRYEELPLPFPDKKESNRKNVKEIVYESNYKSKVISKIITSLMNHKNIS